MAQSPTARAEALIEALPFIQKFRGQLFVIKYGGSAMEDEGVVERFLRDVVFLAFPRPVAHIFMSEITIWIGLWRLASRPFRARELEFSYHGRLDLGMLVVVLVTAPVEILLFELLIPWAALRWFLLAAALYSAIWFVGITFAPMIHQHVARLIAESQ